MKRGYHVISSLNKFVIYALFVLISFFVFYPLVYVVSAAFSPSNNIAGLSIIPFGDGFTWKHFIYLFTKTQYWLWFKNTLIISLWTAVLTVVIASLSAYVFSRFKFTFKKSFLMSLLILQIFPSFVGMIAIYVILYRINGLDTSQRLATIGVNKNTFWKPPRLIPRKSVSISLVIAPVNTPSRWAIASNSVSTSKAVSIKAVGSPAYVAGKPRKSCLVPSSLQQHPLPQPIHK